MRIGINGFGRIGRNFLKALLERHPDLEVVAVNDLSAPGDCAHLFKYDSTYGTWPHEVSHDSNSITVAGRQVAILAERDPAKIPWRAHGVELVVESTGLFTDGQRARGHIDGEAAGARKVIITAPAKNEDLTLVMGVNDGAYDAGKHHVVSNASCTTNCLAASLKPLVDAYGWDKGFMTTVHAYTNDQNIQDSAHKDLRRARAAACNIIPTSSGAAKALYLTIPEMRGTFEGFALRVPTASVSLVHLVATLKKDVDRDALHATWRKAAQQGPLADYLHVNDAPLVSSDFRGSPYSAIIDTSLTQAMGNMVQFCAWYDNEWGYACRLVDLANKMVQAQS